MSPDEPQEKPAPVITIYVDYEVPDERVQKLKHWLATLAWTTDFSQFEFSVIRDDFTCMDTPSPDHSYSSLQLFYTVQRMLDGRMSRCEIKSAIEASLSSPAVAYWQRCWESDQEEYIDKAQNESIDLAIQEIESHALPFRELTDYGTGEFIRQATAEEYKASVEQAKHDGGAGVIEVDGRSCYVV